MKQLALASLFLAPLLVGCVTEDGVPSTDSTAEDGETAPTPVTTIPSFTPSSCAQVHARLPTAADGEYTLYLNGDANLPWTAYCADLQTAPREYLTLRNTGGGRNVAMLADAAGGVVVTEYQRVRIDLVSFMIDIHDARFATSSGSILHAGKPVTVAPFAIAMTCGGAVSANIDLGGTPFRPADRLPPGGAVTMIDYQLAPDRRAMELSVDGACGWISPELVTLEPLLETREFELLLAYFPA